MFFLFSLAVFPEQSFGFDLDFEFELPESWTKMEKNGNESASIIFGNLALLCFIIGNIYTPAKFLARKNSLVNRDAKKSLAGLLNVHIVFNMACFILTVIHSHYAGATSVFLILSLVLMTCLVIGGSFLKYMPKKDFSKRLYLIHTQQTLFGVTIFLLVLGHILVLD